MSRHRSVTRSAAVVALALVSVLVGCGPTVTTDRPNGNGAPTETVTIGVGEDASSEWLRGTWSVDHTLDAVSSAIFEAEAERGTVLVSIEATGSDMRVLVEDMMYSGTVVLGGENFRFEGSGSHVEPDGSTTESDIIISGRRTGLETWTAETWGDIRSEGEAVYEARWLQEAERVP
jgi:hypothetical protein